MKRKKHTELARLATLAAKGHGHELGTWTWGGMWTPGRSVAGKVTGTARCLACQATATINTWPDPDEETIDGAAVVVTCTQKAVTV